MPNFLPQHSWRVWELTQERRYEEAQRVFDDFMVPYGEIVGRIGAQTAGEGVFVKPWMAAMGLQAGGSRLPSRDAAATPETHADIRSSLARQREAVPA